MINYNIIERKSPKDGSVKYYAQASNSDYLTLTDIAENISRECTVTVHDVKAVLSALEEQIILALQNGSSVRLGDLGSFHVTLKSKGVSSKDEFSTSDIERVMVRFIKSVNMKDSFLVSNKNVKFKVVGSDIDSSDDTSDEDPNA